jgi:type IX secretion system PorP/SprF family membrane protein
MKIMKACNPFNKKKGLHKVKSDKKINTMKNIRIQLTILLLLTLGINGFSQQDPMYTQYMNNPIVVNPAFAGSRGVGNLTGVFRKQWLGINGSPATSSISYNAPIKGYDIGFGTNLLYDALGPVTQTGLYLDYSYQIRFNEKSTLALGLKGGFNYYYVNYSGLNYDGPDDDIDQLENESLFLPNFGVGAYYFTDKLYLGLSVPKLIRNSLEKGKNTVEGLTREEWHFFLMGGYVFNLSKAIDLKPSFIARYSAGAPLSLELTATLMLYDKVWLGAMYRVGESFGGLVNWQITPKLNVGYSYDLTHTEIRAFSKGSHEITLNYLFLRDNGKRILSPRFF